VQVEQDLTATSAGRDDATFTVADGDDGDQGFGARPGRGADGHQLSAGASCEVEDVDPGVGVAVDVHRCRGHGVDLSLGQEPHDAFCNIHQPLFICFQHGLILPVHQDAVRPDLTNSVPKPRPDARLRALTSDTSGRVVSTVHRSDGGTLTGASKRL